MALMICAECKGQVSSTAPSCPHCGALFQPPLPPAVPADTKSTLGRGVIVLIVIVLAVAGLNLLDGSSSRTSPAARQWKLIRTVGMQQIVLVDKAQELNEQIYREAIDELCARQTHCYVAFWSDAELTPATYPMTDAEFAGQKANYTYNQTTGHRELLWSCEIVNDPSQCFSPD
jgi:hypothetical protein